MIKDMIHTKLTVDGALTAEEKLFLSELAKLTRKHGIEIGGCGECGSPWIQSLENTEQNFHYAFPDGFLEWTDKEETI